MNATPQQVVDEARTWVGVRYLHQGRSRLGIDCIGLVLEIGKALELLPPELDDTNYSRLPTSGRLLEEISARCSVAPRAEPGTLVVISWSRDPYHVAICTGPTLIHSNATIGKVVEHGYRHPWPGLTQSIWRLPRVKYV